MRQRDDISILPVDKIVSVVAERDMLHLTDTGGERHTIRYPLKDLEARLDPQRFIRVSRSALVCVDAIQRVHPTLGGGFVVWLANKQRIQVSRARAHVLRDVLLKL